MEPTQSTKFLWELPIELSGNRYHARLANIILHTIQLGVLLATREGEFEINEGELANRVRGYAVAANKDYTSRDKFFPLRLTGESMKTVLQHIPLDIQGIRVDRLCFKLSVLRVFAFGHKDHLRTLLSEIDLHNDPDLTALHDDIIYPWGKPKDEADAENLGKGGLSLGAYGQYSIPRKHFKGILEGLEKFSGKLREVTENGRPEFGHVYKIFADMGITYLPGGGIIAWLLNCDLAEYGIIQGPTVKDLAIHLTYKPGHMGPGSVIGIVARWEESEEPKTRAEILTLLTNVYNIVFNPAAPAEIKSIHDRCLEVQGRPLNVIDLEHILCTVARQISVMKLDAKEKKKDKGDSTKKRKRGEEDSAQ